MFVLIAVIAVSYMKNERLKALTQRVGRYEPSTITPPRVITAQIEPIKPNPMEPEQLVLVKCKCHKQRLNSLKISFSSKTNRLELVISNLNTYVGSCHSALDRFLQRLRSVSSPTNTFGFSKNHKSEGENEGFKLMRE